MKDRDGVVRQVHMAGIQPIDMASSAEICQLVVTHLVNAESVLPHYCDQIQYKVGFDLYEAIKLMGSVERREILWEVTQAIYCAVDNILAKKMVCAMMLGMFGAHRANDLPTLIFKEAELVLLGVLQSRCQRYAAEVIKKAQTVSTSATFK